MKKQQSAKSNTNNSLNIDKSNTHGGSTLVSVPQSKLRRNELKRGLTNRHLQLIAIGGTIGTALFLGSAKTIAIAGPTAFVIYCLAGIIMFLAMRFLGEMLLSNLNFRSFRDIATHYLGHWGGFIVGWAYWGFWIVTGMQDCTAVGIYLKGYFPNIPIWLPGLMAVAFILIVNLVTVALFGEIEFWLSLIKILAISIFILGGLYLLLTSNHFTYDLLKYDKNNFTQHTYIGVTSSITNLWSHGGFAPNGMFGFLLGFQMAFLAYTGIECIGTTAAEVKNPTKTLPKAINAIPGRIALFYIGTIFVLITVLPWDLLANIDGSPFVTVFKAINLPLADVIMTLVLITAAVSGANSGLYSTSRMLFGLSVDKQAPFAFGQLNRRKVPRNALFFGFIVIALPLVPVTSINNRPLEAFEIFASWGTGLILIVWTLIIVAYFRYRKIHPDLHNESIFKALGGKVAAAVVVTSFVAVFTGMLFDNETRIGFTLALGSTGVLLLFYFFFIRKAKIK